MGHFLAPTVSFRVFGTFVASVLAASGLLLTSIGALADSPNKIDDDDTVQGSFTTVGGPHHPHVDARTIEHWTGQATVGDQTFSYTMVGADPATEGSSDITVDIVLVEVKVGGRWFRGSDVLDPVMASPLFQASDFSSTVWASNPTMGRGYGGELSAGNTGVQLLDAAMRSQFNKVGTGYHLSLSLAPVHKPVTIDVPAALGTTLTSPRGITYAEVDEVWFLTTVEQLAADVHYVQPHRLALFLTNDVVLYTGGNRNACCVFGAHGVTETTAEGNGSNGRQALQTYIWSSWLTPGFFSPTTRWSQQDVYGLSHELVEWASDPFITNVVPVWKSPTMAARMYGCSHWLEPGDPVIGIGFSMGSDAFIDMADPSYSPDKPFGWGDGTYHMSDEAFLPWFLRLNPNDVSQPTQVASASIGRYTLLGNLNRVLDPILKTLIFDRPSTGVGCPAA